MGCISFAYITGVGDRRFAWRTWERDRGEQSGERRGERSGGGHGERAAPATDHAALKPSEAGFAAAVLGSTSTHAHTVPRIGLKLFAKTNIMYHQSYYDWFYNLALDRTGMAFWLRLKDHVYYFYKGTARAQGLRYGRMRHHCTFLEFTTLNYSLPVVLF